MDTPVPTCKVPWVTTAVTSIHLVSRLLVKTLNSMSETTHAEVRLHARILPTLQAQLLLVMTAVMDTMGATRCHLAALEMAVAMLRQLVSIKVALLGTTSVTLLVCAQTMLAL